MAAQGGPLPGWALPPGGGGFGIARTIDDYRYGRYLPKLSTPLYHNNVRRGGRQDRLHDVAPPAPRPVRVELQEKVNFNKHCGSTHPGFTYVLATSPDAVVRGNTTNNRVPVGGPFVQHLANPGFALGEFTMYNPGQRIAANSPAGLGRRHLEQTLRRRFGQLKTSAHPLAHGQLRRKYALVHGPDGKLCEHSLRGGDDADFEYLKGALFLLHVIDTIHNSQELEDLRVEAHQANPPMDVKLEWFGITVTPDPDKYTGCPNGVHDVMSAILDLVGTAANPKTRADWDNMGLRNVVVFIGPGPDFFSQPSIRLGGQGAGAGATPRMMFADESGVNAVDPSINRGVHFHFTFATVRQASFDPSEVCTPRGQIGAMQVCRYFENRNCGARVIHVESDAPTNKYKSNAPYFQPIYETGEGFLQSLMTWLSYSGFGKAGVYADSQAAHRIRWFADICLRYCLVMRAWKTLPHGNITANNLQRCRIVEESTGRIATVAFLPPPSLVNVPNRV